MSARPYLISNVKKGLERDLEPWLIPFDAFPNIVNFYMFRGRIPRRRGFTQLGRLVTSVTGAVTNPANAVGSSYPSSSPGVIVGGTNISPGSVSITVGAVTFVDSGSFGDQTGVLVGTPGTNSGTINYITGAITLSFSPALGAPTAVIVDYESYDNTPVMGLRTREITAINEEQLVAFDITKANIFSTVDGSFQDISFHKTTGNPFSWTATNSDFFWTINYLNAFWTTNGTKGFQSTVDSTNPVLGDGLRWYDGSGWINFLPQVDGSNYLMGATLMVSYRNRLVMLNTTEGTAFGSSTNYAQRARWCQNGTPYYVAPTPAGFTGGTDINSWRSDIVGKGGFIDAPTQEQIVSAAFYRDTLVVFFERSTWQLRYTGNETLPFVWERINTELGAESTFSTVVFDAGIVGVGNYGIISCDATGVKRIDQIIPDEVFEIHNGNVGVKRVYGIRDFYQQLIYWTFPDASLNPTFPNRVLIYNYIEDSYSFFNDSLTCFGYFQSFDDTSWEDVEEEWQECPFQWNSPALQSQFPGIVAGNQQGFVFNNFNNGSTNNSTPSLFITGATQADPCIITSPAHNLYEGQIIGISDVSGMTQLNDEFYRVSTPINANTFAIQVYVQDPNDPDSYYWKYVDSTAFGAYTSGGLIKVRSNVTLLSKKFNPFIEEGAQVQLNRLDLFVEGTSTGQFAINFYIDENSDTPVQSLLVSSATPSGQDKKWFTVYPNVIGQFVQIEILFLDSQMIDEEASDPDVVIHAITPWFAKGARLIYGENI